MYGDSQDIRATKLYARNCAFTAFSSFLRTHETSKLRASGGFSRDARGKALAVTVCGAPT